MTLTEQARATVLNHWFAAEDTPTSAMEDALNVYASAVRADTLSAVEQEARRLYDESNREDQLATLEGPRDPSKIMYLRGEQGLARQLAAWCRSQREGTK